MHIARLQEAAQPGALRYWVPVLDRRHPWSRKSVAQSIRDWITEAEHGDALVAAGERVMPLLLAGETRCGKTSTLCSIAAEYFEIPAYRMSIGSIIKSHLGETTGNMKAALEEACAGPQALWVMDEVDGIFPQRRADSGGGAVQEVNAAVAVALAMIESLPQHVMLVATTNELDILDKAMIARFHAVQFPRWSELDTSERRSFARSHGYETAAHADSYAEVVQQARKERVRKIIEKAKADRADE